MKRVASLILGWREYSFVYLCKVRDIFLDILKTFGILIFSSSQNQMHFGTCLRKYQIKLRDKIRQRSSISCLKLSICRKQSNFGGRPKMVNVIYVLWTDGVYFFQNECSKRNASATVGRREQQIENTHTPSIPEKYEYLIRHGF